MIKNPLNYLIIIGVIGMVTAAIAAYAGTPFRSVKAFEITCANTATIINNGDGGYNSVRCQNTSSTEVYMGGSAVTTAQGYPVCAASGCADAAITVDASMVNYCIVAAGTQTIRCIAGK